MKQMLYLLTVLLLLVLSPASARKQAEAPKAPVLSAIAELPEQQPRHYSLSDARGLYRVCTTRSQRVMPTHGAKTGKGFGRTAAVQRLRARFTRNFPLRKWRQSSASFRSAAQCDYYVIMLRRIIR